MKQKDTQRRDTRPSTIAGPMSVRWRLALSVLIVLQLLAVVAEPFRFFTLSTRGTSPAADPIRNWLAPHVEFAYLNHGYFFFAPEPGPSHLIDCRMITREGKPARLRFPDRNAQWPRLLYHRHFMLTENLHQLWIHPPHEGLIAEDDPFLPEWTADRQRFELVRASMVQHLKSRYDAQSVEIDRIEHRLPSSEEIFVDGMRLDDPQLYDVLPDAPLGLEPEAASQADSIQLPIDLQVAEGTTAQSAEDHRGRAADSGRTPSSPARETTLPTADTSQPPESQR